MTASRRNCRITVVCRHKPAFQAQRVRRIFRFSWSDNEEWFVEAVDASLRDEGASSDRRAAFEVIAQNERFWMNHTAWTTRKDGKRPKFNDAYVDLAEVDGAGALNGFNFRCSTCGHHRPVRQDSMDKWIQAEISGSNDTHFNLEFDIAS